MANAAIPAYVYESSDGSSIPIYIDVEKGVTPEMILILKEEDHKEALGSRYFKENKDPLTEYLKNCEDADDPVDSIADMTYNPERVFFEPDHGSGLSLKEKVESILPKLSKEQVDLYRYLCMGMKPAQIAPLLNTSPNAICQREKKLFASISRLVKEAEDQGLISVGNIQEEQTDLSPEVLPGGKPECIEETGR